MPRIYFAVGENSNRVYFAGSEDAMKWKEYLSGERFKGGYDYIDVYDGGQFWDWLAEEDEIAEEDYEDSGGADEYEDWKEY